MYDRVKLRALNHSLTEGDVRALAASSHGYVGADVSALCQEAAMCALRRHVVAQQSMQQPSSGQQAGSASVSNEGAEPGSDDAGASTSQAGSVQQALQVCQHLPQLK